MSETTGLKASVVVAWAGRCQAGLGFGIGISFASFLRFWAVAASRNSSRATFGPLSRRRSIFKMRFKCANGISTFLRSRRNAKILRSGAPCRARPHGQSEESSWPAPLHSSVASTARLRNRACRRGRYARADAGITAEQLRVSKSAGLLIRLRR